MRVGFHLLRLVVAVQVAPVVRRDVARSAERGEPDA